MSIGKNIKRLRKEAGLSQEKLAQMLGKTRSAVSYYESDTIIPRMGVIEELASIFNVSKTEIIDTAPSFGKLTESEVELLRIMRRITPEGQRQLMIYARGIDSTYSKNNQVEKTA